MATEAQINANRENAKKSTGPRTPEGKRASMGNAVKNGAYATYATLYALEGKDDLVKLHEAIRQDVRPHGAVQELLCEQLASIHHRIRRLQMCEARTLDKHIKEAGDYPNAMARDHNISHDSLHKMASQIARLHREFRQTTKALREEQLNEPAWLAESYIEREAAGEFKTKPIFWPLEVNYMSIPRNTPPKKDPETAFDPIEFVEKPIK